MGKPSGVSREESYATGSTLSHKEWTESTFDQVESWERFWTFDADCNATGSTPTRKTDIKKIFVQFRLLPELLQLKPWSEIVSADLTLFHL
jgi:hypothetical protein